MLYSPGGDLYLTLEEMHSNRWTGTDAQRVGVFGQLGDSGSLGSGRVKPGTADPPADALLPPLYAKFGMLKVDLFDSGSELLCVKSRRE